MAQKLGRLQAGENNTFLRSRNSSPEISLSRNVLLFPEYLSDRHAFVRPASAGPTSCTSERRYPQRSVWFNKCSVQHMAANGTKHLLYQHMAANGTKQLLCQPCFGPTERLSRQLARCAVARGVDQVGRDRLVKRRFVRNILRDVISSYKVLRHGGDHNL